MFFKDQIIRRTCLCGSVSGAETEPCPCCHVPCGSLGVTRHSCPWRSLVTPLPSQSAALWSAAAWELVTRCAGREAPVRDYWFLVLLPYFAPSLKENTFIAFDFVFIHKMSRVKVVLWSQCRHISCSLFVLCSFSCNCWAPCHWAGGESGTPYSAQGLEEWLPVEMAAQPLQAVRRHCSSTYSELVLPQNQCFHVAADLLCCFSHCSCLILFHEVQVPFVTLPSP